MQNPPNNNDHVNTQGLKRILLLAFGSASQSVEIHDPDEAGRLLRDICARQATSADTLLDAASDPRTSLDDLRFLVALGRWMMKDTTSARESEATRLLCHLAAAAAMGRFRCDISVDVTGDRDLLYERLAILFAGHRFGDVFQGAAEGMQELVAQRLRKRSSTDSTAASPLRRR